MTGEERILEDVEDFSDDRGKADELRGSGNGYPTALPTMWTSSFPTHNQETWCHCNTGQVNNRNRSHKQAVSQVIWRGGMSQ